MIQFVSNKTEIKKLYIVKIVLVGVFLILFNSRAMDLIDSMAFFDVTC